MTLKFGELEEYRKFLILLKEILENNPELKVDEKKLEKVIEIKNFIENRYNQVFNNMKEGE